MDLKIIRPPGLLRHGHGAGHLPHGPTWHPRRCLRHRLRCIHKHPLLPAGPRRSARRPFRLQTGSHRCLCHLGRRLFLAWRLHQVQYYLRRPRPDRCRRLDHQADHLGHRDQDDRGRQHEAGWIRSLLHDDQCRRAHRPRHRGPSPQPYRVPLRFLGVGSGLRADVPAGGVRLPRAGVCRRAFQARPWAIFFARS